MIFGRRIRPSKTHGAGELFVDSNGTLYYCVTSGTPGTWVRVAPAATPQAIQSGTAIGAGPSWSLYGGSGDRYSTTHVSFGTDFNTLPTISTAIAEFDIINTGGNYRLELITQNVTTSGFDVVFHTWGDSSIYGARAQWTAIGY